MNSDEILDILLKKGVISQVDLEELETSSRNPKFRQAVESYHALMCPADHDHGCMFHEETIKEGTWERADHISWANEVRRIIQNYNISVDTLLSDIQLIVIIVNKHGTLSDAGKEIFKDLFIDPETL